MRDHWYPLCDASALSTDAPHAATLLGDPLVLFRDAAGAPACTEDRCAHRSAPLSLGRVEGGRIECPYHGWQYDRAGRCARIPSLAAGAAAPDGACVRAYPCVERAGLIWVWPGDAQRADDDAGAALGDLDGWCVVRGSLDLDVDHGLVIENLLDLAHAPFAHEGTLASRDEACGLDVAISQGARGVRGVFRRAEDGCVSAQSVSFEAPCAVRFDLEAGPDEGRITQVHHAVPLARGRTRWMWRVARDWLRDVPALDAVLAGRAAAVVDQDARLLRAQQSRIDQGAPAWGCAVPADAAALAYRAWRARHERADTWFAGFAARGVSGR
jgi:chlorophyllide a oxygenase